MNNLFKTPILFLIFNRPDTTQKVFEKIREIKPEKLFVSADGPRRAKNEEERVIAARNIIKQVDWDCEIKTKFSEENLGCKVGVSSGIDWFFSQVDEGIILEDDCLPDLSFFTFCSELLVKYRDDERVMHIGGTNFQDGRLIGNGSYYFSRLVHIWGWASWKRSWNKYNVGMLSYDKFKESGIIEDLFPDKRQQKYWIKNFSQVYMGGKDTWDFQWVYTVMVNNGVSIIPNSNLVTNLGFGEEATHTTLKGSSLSKRKTETLKDITHPEFLVPSRTADDYTFVKYLNPGKLSKLHQVVKSKLT